MIQIFTSSRFFIMVMSFLCSPHSYWSFQVLPLRMNGNGRGIGVRTCLKGVVDLDAIESKAVEASENWDISVTPFLSEENIRLLEERLAKRADVGYVRVGGLPASSRNRFVMSNPDMTMDLDTAESEYCVLLCVDGIDKAQLPGSSPWPHILTKIGVELEDVGDVVVEDTKAYMTVVPEMAKRCCRLLPKELRGIGLSISILEPEDYRPSDGELQNMQLGKLDKRALKYM